MGRGFGVFACPPLRRSIGRVPPAVEGVVVHRLSFRHHRWSQVSVLGFDGGGGGGVELSKGVLYVGEI